MKTPTTSPLALATAPSGPSLVGEAFEALAESFEQFCLMAGIESLIPRSENSDSFGIHRALFF